MHLGQPFVPPLRVLPAPRSGQPPRARLADAGSVQGPALDFLQVLEFEQRQQQVFGPDVGVAEPKRLANGQLERLARWAAERDKRRRLGARWKRDARARRVSVSTPCRRSGAVANAPVVARARRAAGLACLVTPMLSPISVQDAPERRAWSTKCPIRWSATSLKCSARAPHQRVGPGRRGARS